VKVHLCPLVDFGVLNDNLIKGIISFVKCMSRFLMGSIGVFCTSKIHGGQDHAFLFRSGLTNCKTHYGLSWFMPLLGGNSHTSSDLI
jgi:hypothetical protein